MNERLTNSPVLNIDGDLGDGGLFGERNGTSRASGWS